MSSSSSSSTSFVGDMFTSLNNDLLQCILYEWLTFKDICQLDIAVCNHSQRSLYYEALQSSTLPLIKKLNVTEKELFELIQWSKQRNIKNPIETIEFNNNKPMKIRSQLTTKDYYELSKDFQQLIYIKTIKTNHWNSFSLHAISSLHNLTSLTLYQIEIEFSDHPWIGLVFQQLSSLKEIELIEVCFDPILLLYLSQISSLTSLSIENYTLETHQTNDFYQNISTLTQLKSISLNEIQRSPFNALLDLSFLLKLPKLQELTLFEIKFTLTTILQLTQLTQLTLNTCKPNLIDVSNINYEDYEPFSRLEYIAIDSDDLKSDFIQFIFQCKQLKTFSMEFSRCYETSTFYSIYQLSHLIQLTLHEVNIDEQLFHSFCGLTQLQRLILRGDYDVEYDATLCFPFSQLSKQLSLLYVHLYHFINDENIFEISQLVSLTELSFSWYSDSFEGLQPLSNLKQLKELSISGIFKVEDQLTIKKMIRGPKIILKRNYFC